VSITDADRASVATFLREHRYADLEEWAHEGHTYSDVSCEWYSMEDNGPFASPVDLEAACFAYIERQGELQDERRYGG
jgi:hypothetical protein